MAERGNGFCVFFIQGNSIWREVIGLSKARIQLIKKAVLWPLSTHLLAGITLDQRQVNVDTVDSGLINAAWTVYIQFQTSFTRSKIPLKLIK